MSVSALSLSMAAARGLGPKGLLTLAMAILSTVAVGGHAELLRTEPAAESRPAVGSPARAPLVQRAGRPTGGRRGGHRP